MGAGEKHRPTWPRETRKILILFSKYLTEFSILSVKRVKNPLYNVVYIKGFSEQDLRWYSSKSLFPDVSKVVLRLFSTKWGLTSQEYNIKKITSETVKICDVLLYMFLTWLTAFSAAFSPLCLQPVGCKRLTHHCTLCAAAEWPSL